MNLLPNELVAKLGDDEVCRAGSRPEQDNDFWSQFYVPAVRIARLEIVAELRAMMAVAFYPGMSDVADQIEAAAMEEL